MLVLAFCFCLWTPSDHLRFVLPGDTTFSGQTRFSITTDVPEDEILGIELQVNGTLGHYFEEPPYEITLDMRGFPKGKVEVKAVLTRFSGAKEETILEGTNLTVDLEENVHLVRIPVLVEQPGVQLQPSDFKIFENDQPQQLRVMMGEDKPLFLLVLLDLSTSMEARISLLRNSMYALLDGLRPGDIVQVVGFNHRVFELCPPETDMEVVRKSLSLMEAKGDTNLYGAVWSGLKALGKTRERRALLLFTDGDHTVLEESDLYHKTQQDCIDIARQQGVPLFSIGFGVKVNRTNLEELSSTTGGKAIFQASPKKLAEVFANISVDLRHQYLLCYATKAESGAQTIRVETTIPDLQLSYPKTIYLTEAQNQ